MSVVAESSAAQGLVAAGPPSTQPQSVPKDFVGTPYKRTDLVQMLYDSTKAVQDFDWEGYKATREGGLVTGLPLNEDFGNGGEEGSLTTNASLPHILKIQAPMVRCSRPPFRKLCRLYGTDISYSRMIMADSFVNHPAAREADFAVYEGEDRLIVQLAGTNPQNMGKAATLLSPYCDAIDINCGCPQKWAMKEGIGAAMMNTPELVSEIVKQVRNQSGLPCVVKSRVFKDDRKTVDFARQQVAAGAGWLTVHGRTYDDLPSAPVRYDAIKVVQESVPVPIVVNGSIETYNSVIETAERCRVGGVMSARALLDNPAVFEESFRHIDHRLAPIPNEVMSDYMRLAFTCDGLLPAVRHHLLLMMHQMLTPSERNIMNSQASLIGLMLHLKQTGYWTDEGRFTELPQLPPFSS